MNKRKVITLCGSTKFKETFENVQKDLTLQGNVIFSLDFFSKSDNISITPDLEKLLFEIHLQKIDMSDEIFVINVDGYIGESTKKEIEYAKQKGKTVTYLETPYKKRTKSHVLLFLIKLKNERKKIIAFSALGKISKQSYLNTIELIYTFIKENSKQIVDLNSTISFVENITDIKFNKGMNEAKKDVLDFLKEREGYNKNEC